MLPGAAAVNPQLLKLAARLERDGKRLEAQALRVLLAAYRDLSLADLITLIGAASQGESARQRVAGVETLMRAFDEAARALQTPPVALEAQLRSAVLDGLTAGMQMLAAQAAEPELFDMFRLRPDAEIEFTRHASERLARYWGVEQTRLRNEVQSVLLEGLERGQSVQQMRARLRERVDVSRSRASLIVRNELSNASAFAQRESQQEAGVKEFIWWTASDDRVRAEHKARHGKKYSWDNPPGGEVPGSPILCRCVALAVLPPST